MDLASDTAPNRAALCADLASASARGQRMRIVGGGSGGRRGRVPHTESDVISTRTFDRIISHEPADLVATVEAGVAVADLQAALALHGQTWIQAPTTPHSTVGGVLARAESGLRRLRYGAIRDSVLQVVAITGDGRLIQAGGKTVKGVAGYDIPRLMVGAYGTLGVIVEVTLKLWPIPPSSQWFTAEGSTETLTQRGEQIRREIHQPGAIITSADRLWVELIGPSADLVAPDGMHAGEPPPALAGAGRIDIGVGPAQLPGLVTALARRGYTFQAQLGVGTCTVIFDDLTHLNEIRQLAIDAGGHATIADAPDELRNDPWGPPPAGIALMQRLKTACDPALILNHGQFIGDLEGAR